MADPNKEIFPFITRKDLSFESGTLFDIEVVHYATNTGTVQLIGITKEGPFVFSFANGGTGARASSIFRIADIPIFLTLHGNVAAMNRGEFYGTVYLRMNGTRILRLCGGYVWRDHGISYPQTENVDENAGKGFVVVVSGSNPAAGSEILQTVPTGRLWRVRGIKFTLVAAAAAASRRVHLQFYVGGAIDYFETFAATDQIISETKEYHCLPLGSAAANTAGNSIYIPLPPDLILGEGDQIATLTDNLNASDNFGAPQFWIEQLFEDL